MDTLLADPWLGSYARDEPWARQEKDGSVTRGAHKFHRFSQSTSSRVPTLMVEQDGGERWWVVGYMSNPVDWLPEWEMSEAGKQIIERWNRGEPGQK